MGPLTDEVLAFGRQVGATDYACGPSHISRERGHYGFQELMIARNRVEDAGLKWTVAGMPEEWTHQIKLGLPGRDRQLTSWCRSIENLGAAGVPVICYFFSLRSAMGSYGLRTSRSTPGRGGARVTSFDRDQIRAATQDFWDPPVDRSLEVTDRQVWDNVTWFLERVVPVAEDAGVTLALHPDDPPVSPIGGVARVFRNHAALRRVVDIVPSAANGLTFCVGTIAAMPGDVFEAIRYFGTPRQVPLRALQERDGHGTRIRRDVHRRGVRGHGAGDARLPRGRLRRPHGGGPRAGDGGRPQAVAGQGVRAGLYESRHAGGRDLTAATAGCRRGVSEAVPTDWRRRRGRWFVPGPTVSSTRAAFRDRCRRPTR